jgi:hypothetical protein
MGIGVFYFGLRGWSAICLSFTFSFHAIHYYYSQLHTINVHTLFLENNFSATKTGFCLVQIQFWTGFKVCLLTINQSINQQSSGATALQGLGRQSSRHRPAKLVTTSTDRGVSRGQRNGSPRPLISVYRTWIATYFIQVAPQLTSRGWVHPVPDPLPLRKSGIAGNRTRDLCVCSQKPHNIFCTPLQAETRTIVNLTGMIAFTHQAWPLLN